MKKSILMFVALLALTTGVASAAGTALRWNLCLGDGGLPNKPFACNTNTGNHILNGSFVLPADLLRASGTEVVLDLASASAVLPAWWSFKNTGTCRQLSTTYNATNAAAANCPDWSAGQAAGGVGAYNIGQRGPNTARLIAATAVPGAALQDLLGGQEYFAFQLVINSAKTVGTGACEGCLTPVCIVFNSVNVTTPVAANNVKVSGASNGTDADFATWQGGGAPQTPVGSGCPAATPTRSSTWGAVKSLYR